MHDRIEWLVGAESGSDSQRAVEAFGDVLDRHFVGKGPVATCVDHRDVVSALFEDALPYLERCALVRIAVDENDRIARHSGKYTGGEAHRLTAAETLYL